MSIKTIKGLPLFEAKMASGNCGVLRVSLVDAPAVESDFVSYGENERPKLYEVTDEEKRRVFGVVLRADYPIYRADEQGEYYIIFRPDDIRAFAQKYLADGLQNEVDLNHDFKSIEGAQMVQYFIKDTEGGIAPAGFEEIADGSLFAEYQITDEDLWQRIKDGEFKGFSVEIIHAEVPAEYQKINPKTRISMSKIEKLKAALAKGFAAIEAEVAASLASYGSVATDKGTVIWDGDEDLKAGDKVYTEDAEGNRIELVDGDYKTEDGKVIVVAAGEVSEIKDAEAEVAPEAAAETQAEEIPAAPAEPTDEKDEKDARIAELEAKLAEAEATIAERDAEIAELKEKLDTTPAGEPAHDAYKKADKQPAENFIETYKRYRR